MLPILKQRSDWKHICDVIKYRVRVCAVPSPVHGSRRVLCNVVDQTDVSLVQL